MYLLGIIPSRAGSYRHFRRPGRLLLLLTTLVLLAAPWGAALSQEDTLSLRPATEAPAGGTVLITPLRDVIGPISARYTLEALETARDRGMNLVIIEMDTPGGLDTSMRQIIQAVLASPVPVCVYVAPEGSRAASAGVYISMAAHVAAMAPGTNIGAATPVNMGGGMDSTMTHKVTNDAEAYIRSLARLRERNESWSASAVIEAKSIQAEEALELGVIDLIATGPRDLLRQLDGRRVSVPGDSARVLQVRDATVERFELSARWRILSLLNNPTVAYLLLMLGFYGLFFELSNPGAIFPGVAGALCLILGLIGLQTLTLNYAGLLLMVLALVLFFLEIKVASGGLLTVGGVAALLGGSLMLFDSPEPFLRVSMKVIIPTVLVTAAFFLFAVTMALRAQKRKVISGREGLVGMIAEVRRDLNPEGGVFVAGEDWNAELVGGGTAVRGTRVEVVSMDHLKLKVRPVQGS